MRVLPPRVPPELTITVSWRELWLGGFFIQQRLINQSKLLVRVQNRYLPEVTGSVNLPFDAELGERVDPYRREVEGFDAQAVVGELGVEHEQIFDAYWFLVERGIDREPCDEMERLRRARPRSAYKNWRGPVRRAHDHYQAAEVLRLLLTELTGEPPGRPPGWPMDGRQPFRGSLYDQGPVPRLSRGERQEELIATRLARRACSRGGRRASRVHHHTCRRHHRRARRAGNWVYRPWR